VTYRDQADEIANDYRSPAGLAERPPAAASPAGTLKKGRLWHWWRDLGQRLREIQAEIDDRRGCG
jgi:hypothetical protein